MDNRPETVGLLDFHESNPVRRVRIHSSVAGAALAQRRGPTPSRTAARVPTTESTGANRLPSPTPNPLADPY
ncbi:arabinogalactan protein [Haloferax volcanii]|uniref:Arabinogalactan protein n=1 Tax=Haloferax volcanii TaxID=2246 RepID=A0A558G2Y2_HALVO|nr:arabinogalactan protein [Haloferax volcanii]